MMDQAFDCVVIGGGPAGLTAALYLARFRRSTLVIDAGQSRASRIPIVRNLAGFEGGISGKELIVKMRRQVDCYPVPIIAGRVVAIRQVSAGFVVDYRSSGDADRQSALAHRVLLAFGIRDRLPPIVGAERLTEKGLLRLCAICDGFEAQGKRAAMLGSASRALSHALFFRTFCRQVAVVAPDLSALTQEQRASAVENAIELVPLGALEASANADGRLSVVCPDGRLQRFDIVYPVLGSREETELLSGLNVERDEDGMIVADKRQRTSVAGIFAAGDAVNSLNQICVAVGEAAIAATAIHCSLPGNPL
ncbi:NAD(P)/FAD-dependent oxidoreductase [Caballeronia sp. ATUFL_F1_KS39]|uniref:NAD(P)/FAD-dependent oxidoreductase n=1 Tax=Caballeronia sp. ATUFL_F1_KS39 TaxID=2921766 RepID=UPI002028EB62|nr:NAD(P)/FAD-dependent oxidoreductase [Caballeronia sp. ATUFL_F1_KS39]